MALLDKYDAPLTYRQVAHLLRRITFGSTVDNIKKLTGKTAETITKSFLADTNAPDPPKDYKNKTFHDLPWGYPATESNQQNQNDGTRRAIIKWWWIAQMINQQGNVIEKMTLFWQNHFVSTTSESDARIVYLQYQLLRKNALGNFRTFVQEITKDPAMLLYLDGNQNVVGKPNENFARELQELFTIGQGNYDENDVKNAAKVLTGWRPQGYRNTKSSEISVEFKPDLHDTSDKNFSSFYQNKIIKGRTGANAGNLELAELTDMILAQDATALFIVRKIYRWFVQAEISESIENDFIKPLAAVFRKDYEIKPVLSLLFNSRHFFEDSLIGSQIKSPLDLIIGTLLHFNQVVPDSATDRATYDFFTQYLGHTAEELQMEVFDQPTVFGWRPYYDTGFYQLWINSTTLALRGAYTDSLISGALSKIKINVNTLDLVRNVSKPSDPIVLINEVTNYLFAIDLTQSQKDFIIDEVLIPGLPRYEWGVEWDLYASDPGNAAKKNVVKTKIDSMYLYLLRLAEFQMG